MALLILTTDVNGAIQLSVWIKTGKEDSGKKTPLNRNIGVINKLK